MKVWRRKLRIVIEYDAEALPLEDVNAMVENFKRNLEPTPEDVYFELVEEGKAWP